MATARVRRGSVASTENIDDVSTEAPQGIDESVLADVEARAERSEPEIALVTRPPARPRRRSGMANEGAEAEDDDGEPPAQKAVHQDVEIWDVQVRRRITTNSFANGFYAITGYCVQKGMEIKVTGTCEGMEIMEGNTLQIVPDMNTLEEEVYRGNVQTAVNAIMTTVMPNRKSPREISKWLEGFHGIGPVRAKAICDVLCQNGRDPFESLEQPEILIAGGIPEDDARNICQKYQVSRIEQRAMIYLMSLAQSNGKPYLNKGQIASVLKSKKFDLKNIRSEVEADPWALAEVDGIGFQTADTLACEFFDHGLSDKRRIRAGLLYTLTKVGDGEGHCGLCRDELAREAADSRVLNTDTDRIYPVLDEVVEQGDLVVVSITDRDGGTRDLIMRPDMDSMENYIVDRLTGILERGPNMPPETADELADRFAAMSGVELDATQKRAVCAALVHGVAVITGGPGTGKSTVQDVIFAAREYYEKTRSDAPRDYAGGDDEGFLISPTCPTGKGAVRLAEATGRPAMTIHRWLKWNPKIGGFGFNEENPHPADELTVDEISMGGVKICYHQLAALRKDTGGVKYVGDDHQIPSVDAGNFQADLIDSGLIPVEKLDATHRQAKGSGIPIVSKRILDGFYPFEENEELRGIKHVNIEGSLSLSEIVDIVVRQCVEMGCSPDTDISIMSPIHKTALGDVCVNAILKEAVNPVTDDDRTEEIIKGQRVLDDGSPDETANNRRRKTSDKEMAKFTFTLGDVVMNTKNDMRMGFMNGETGTVTGFKSVFARNAKGEELDYKLRTILVEVDGRTIVYDPQKLECIPYAEAKTVHKEQGSQSSIAVVIIPEGDTNMSKKLLYTALTRGESYSFIVGSADALMKAINNNGPDRQTGLAYKLSQKIEPLRKLYNEKGWDCSFLENNQRIIDQRIAHREEVIARAARGLRAPEWARRQTTEMTNALRRRKAPSAAPQRRRRSGPVGAVPALGRAAPIPAPTPRMSQPVTTPVSAVTAAPAPASAPAAPQRMQRPRRMPPGINPVAPRVSPVSATPRTATPRAAASHASATKADGADAGPAPSGDTAPPKPRTASAPSPTLSPPVRHVVTSPARSDIQSQEERSVESGGVPPLETSAARRVNIRRRVVPSFVRKASDPSP